MSDQIPWSQPNGSAPPAPPIPPSPERRAYPRRGGIGAGIVLIALGLLFFVGQFVPGVTWWQMWPLFIVLLGAVQIVTPDPRDGWGLSRILDGVGTVLIGLVLLGNTTGFIAWGVWLALLSLWPVLLIALGIAIVGRALGQSWVRALSPLVIWAALGYAVAISLTGMGGYRPLAPFTAQWAGPGQAFDISEPAGATRAATLTFDGGAGDIRVAGSSDSLVSARGTSPFGQPSLVANRSGDRADVVLGLGDRRSVVGIPGLSAGQIDVGLSDSVAWDATFNTGASNLEADLTNVRLSGLTLKTGASHADLKLGAPAAAEGTAAPTPVVVKAGVSSVTLRLPRGAAARIRSSSGLSAIDVAPEFARQADGSWQTAGFSATESGYDVSIESGVGNVAVQTY